MASNYPNNYDQLNNPAAGNLQNSAEVPHHEQHENANDAIEAVETELGLNPSGPHSTVRERLDNIEQDVQSIEADLALIEVAAAGTVVELGNLTGVDNTSIGRAGGLIHIKDGGVTLPKITIANRALIVPSYTTQATRDVGIPAPTQGMLSTRQDDKALDYYNGTRWERLNTPGMRRNMIDNAAGNISQRRYATDNIANAAGTFPSADRWRLEATYAATTPLFQHAIVDVVTPEGLDRAVRVTVQQAKSVLAANDHLVMYQMVEGTTLRATQALAGLTSFKPTVCSFWVYTTVAGDYVVEFRLNDASTTGISYISRSVSLSANQWQKVVINLPAATTGTAISGGLNGGAIIFFWLSAGSLWNAGGTLNTNWSAAPAGTTRVTGQTNFAGTLGATWHVTNVQWEVGTVPTPFERLSWDQDMIRCMRYYQMLTAQSTNTPQHGEGNGPFRFYGTGHMGTTSLAIITLDHIVPMRAAVAIIEASAASGFQLWEGSRQATATALAAQTDANNPYTTRLDVSCAGGLVEGNAVTLRSNNNNTSYLGLSADI